MFFSNYTKKEVREAAMSMGAVDFVVKSDMTPKNMADKIKDF